VKAQVLFRDRRGRVQPFSLRGAESVIGRDTGIAVPISRDGVSRRHARIVVEGGEYVLEDLDSTNGTFLNGQQVARDALRHLDVISLGKDLDLIFLLRGDEARTIRKVGVLDAALLRDAPGAGPEPIPPGEVTLGRSTACNIVSPQGAVSKIHCRIVRTQTQVTVEDLGSSNGTFVNGERLMTAILHDGDSLGLASVEVYKVIIQLGEVATSGIHDAPAAPRTGEHRRFSGDWKTRYEWDPAEREEIEKLQKQLRLEDAQRQAAAGSGTVKQGAVTPPKKGAAPSPSPKSAPPAAPAKGLPQPTPSKTPQAAPSPAKPTRPAPGPAERPTPAVPKELSKAPAATPGPPPAPAKAPTASAPPVAVPTTPPEPPPKPTVAKAAAATPPGKITGIRLRSGDIDVALTETGAHEVGRAKEAAVRVRNPTVSRQHARLIISDDRGVAYVQDRGGANGTRLNGVAITEIKLLNDGDSITVGEVELKVTILRE
jgi:pSer/pThr/pTyr-binding forkhead associated (FHA) protein